MNCPVHFSLTHRRHHCHACGKVITHTKIHTYFNNIVNQMELTFSLRLIGHRLCAETAAGIKSPWNTWRTDEPKCVINATVSFARMVSFCVCSGELKNLKENIMKASNHNMSINNKMVGFNRSGAMVEVSMLSWWLWNLWYIKWIDWFGIYQWIKS